MKKLFLLSLASLFILTSCFKKRWQEDPTANDIGTVESYFGDLKDIVDDGSDGDMNIYKSSKKNNCATATLDYNQDSVSVLIIDYGTVNCECIDGKERRGTIIATFDGGYRDSGTIIDITTDNFFVNDHQLEGTETVTNEGTNSDGFTWYSVDIDGVLTRPNGETITYLSNRERLWIEGEGTFFNILDDVYEITGTAEGNNSSGNGYTMEITSPLNVKIGCPFIRSGVIDLIPNGEDTRIVDFGNGDCDANYSVTVNGRTWDLSVQ